MDSNKAKASAAAYPMLPVDAALTIILNEVQQLQCTEVQLAEAAGMILAKQIVSAEAIPPFRASMKDGYAVRSQDGVGPLRVIGEIKAGSRMSYAPRLEPKSCMRITTGAVVPEGSDAVVMVEHVRRTQGDSSDDLITLDNPIKAGADIRPVGSDIDKGAVVLNVGEALGAAEIGLLASLGISRVPVVSQPSVGVLSSGDELVSVVQRPSAGQIRDSNRPMLLAALAASSNSKWRGVDLGISVDDERDLTRKIRNSIQMVDVLLTSGGVSMGGDVDLIKPILEREGKVHFGRVLMKPGKPLTFATIESGGRKRFVFGLPGNPVSSLVCFYLFVVPALRKMSGWPRYQLPRLSVTLGQALQLDPERPEYHRANLIWDASTGSYVARSTGAQTSSRLLSARSANALLVLPQKQGTLPTGEKVEAILISSLD